MIRNPQIFFVQASFCGSFYSGCDPSSNWSFSESINNALRTGGDWLVIEIPLNILGKLLGCRVTPGGVLFQAFHHDGIQIAYEYESRQPSTCQAKDRMTKGETMQGARQN